MSQPEFVLALALTFGALATALIARTASARTRSTRACVLAVPAVTIVAMFAIVGSDLRVNFTPSMPLGIYRLEALPANAFARGAFVVACAPADAAALGRNRGYLARGPCPGDTEQLLKVVAGVPGDEVTVSTRGVYINGCVLPNSVPLALDRSGRRLTEWPSGRYHLAPNQLWLYAGNPRSWDSRYWGPALVADVIARAKPIFAPRPTDRANNRCFQNRRLTGGTVASFSEDKQMEVPEQPRWLEGIKGDQSRRLIESDGRVIKVLAGPGAGKTTCLKRRVLRLVDTAKVKRAQIFVGTFTRVIAKALQEAFIKPQIEANEEEDDPVVSTLHSHAARLLRENPDAVQGRGFRFLLAHEEKVLLYDIADKVAQFPTFADRNAELKKLQAHWASPRNLNDERFAGAVDEWLRMHGGMLVGEVVYITTDAIQSGNIPVVQFKHVFVDEYQDLTECEQTFVDLITAGDGSVVVLGDDDQSIYGFRYNHPEGITAFPSDEERRRVVEQIPLPDNFRCAKKIVSLANGIAAAAGSQKEPMIPALAEDGRVDFVVWRTLDDEISGLAEVIKARQGNILVLVTRQFIGYRLKTLIGDDAVTTFHEEVLQVPFVRARFALATLYANEDDRVSLRAWFALHAEKPDQADHRNVAAYRSALQSHKTGLDLINGIADGSVILAGEGKANIKKRADYYLEFKALAPADLQAAIEMLFDPALADTMPGRPAPARETATARTNRQRLEQEDRDHARGDLDLLRRAALQIMQNRRQPTLLDVIEDLRYKIGTRAPLIDDDNVPRVRVMTLHGAKGLEEETVVVAGLSDEIVPGIKHKDPVQDAAHVAEQRRLLYVAVTRAKRELVLSWSLAIANAETFPNGIVRKRFDMNRNGVVYTKMTRTSLLPQQPERPQDGSAWKQAQIEAARVERAGTAPS